MVMIKKGISIPKIIEDTCKSIFKKTRSKAIFYATAKIQLPPDPIEDISTDFPFSTAELQDFFHMHKANDRNAEIRLSFTMPGTTEAALHDSMRNTLRQNLLWLTSNELSAKQKDKIGFVQNVNPTYTYPQVLVEMIQAAIIKMASMNPEAAALVAKIKGKQFIFCRSNKIYGFKAIGEGIQMLTTNNNYGIVMQLIGMLPPNSISPYYQLRPKKIKREMKPELYDRMIHLHQEVVNKQEYIELTSVDVDLFEAQVNFVQNNPKSVPITIRKFLQGPGKVLAIEQTINTEESGKHLLIISNKDHSHSIKKIGELLVHLMKEKDTLPTIISSLARFLSYPEMNGRPPITVSLSDQVAALKLQVASQFVPQMITTHSHPVKTSIWDPPLNITTTTVQVSATTTPILYKSAVQNQLATTNQSKSNQI